MAKSHTRAPTLNPWLLHLRKLGLELSCSSCLSLYNQPVLLPCNHILCSSCVSQSNVAGLECSICNLEYAKEELRQAPFMEKVVDIYRSLDASISKHMHNSDNGRVSQQGLLPANSNASNQLAIRSIDSSLPEKSISKHHEIALALEALDVDVNQVVLYQDSPSSGVSKGVVVGSRNPRINGNAEKCSQKKSSKRSVNNYEAQGINGHCDSALKKQKLLCLGHSPPSMCINTQLSTIADAIPTSASSPDENDSTSLVNFSCGFCHTWKITEASGPMQHFANGTEAFGSNAAGSNVVHLHKNCIDWAPQLYYDSQNILKNVDKELARAEKLKCISCGLKGAALGCFARSCRKSYHAPCAFGTEKCRLDEDEFLIFCPSHASQKFPSEKLKKSLLKKCKKSTQSSDVQKRATDSDFWASSPTGAKKWVLCGSALSVDEKFMVVEFAKLCGATVVRAWNPNVSHVIAATDANGACSRTLKVLRAILEGQWVLNMNWVISCMQSKRPVDEEPYEIKVDIHGCNDGPKSGRLRVLNNERKLFSGLKFFFAGEFGPTYKNDLQSLVIAAGGTILETREILQECCRSDSSPSTTLILYNSDAVLGSEDGFGEVSERRVEAETLAADNGSRVIAHTWILDSIASNTLQVFAL